MDEMISSGNASYDLYEELLLRRAALRKECIYLEREYTRIFGEEILTLCRLKIECARKKKTIEFCQRAVNRGEEPDEAELQEFIRKETRELQKHFREMAEVFESSQEGVNLPERDLLRIRKIYRRIVKLLHPDLHPELAQSEELQDLWNKVSIAYSCNDLKELEELEVLVAAALADRGGDDIQVEVPDLDARIEALEAEITAIMDSDPYQYKFLLEDSGAIREKKAALQEEISAYRDYSCRLDGMLADILPPGMIIIWDEE